MDAHLKLMLDELTIPEAEQRTLAQVHGIVDYSTLRAKQSAFENRQLGGQVSEAAQEIIASALMYLDDVQCIGNPVRQFSKGERRGGRSRRTAYRSLS